MEWSNQKTQFIHQQAAQNPFMSTKRTMNFNWNVANEPITTHNLSAASGNWHLPEKHRVRLFFYIILQSLRNERGWMNPF